MIDTDKYERHTPGPWVCTHSPVNGGKQFWSVVDHTQPTDVGDDTLGNWRIADIIDFEADAQLIADAPLLLAEVKRLREDNKKLHDAIDRCAYRGREGSAYDLYIESIIQHVGEECEEE